MLENILIDVLIHIENDLDRKKYWDFPVSNGIWNGLYKKSVILDNNIFFRKR